MVAYFYRPLKRPPRIPRIILPLFLLSSRPIWEPAERIADFIMASAGVCRELARVETRLVLDDSFAAFSSALALASSASSLAASAAACSARLDRIS